MQKYLINKVYDTVMGVYESDGFPGVESEFEEGKVCDILYSQAYDAYCRLCERLGKAAEDDDLEIMVNSFMKITRLVGAKMFIYGAQLGSI